MTFTTAQKAQLAFVVFTIGQIIQFIKFPHLCDEFANGMDVPPLYAYWRLIGTKEVGLMRCARPCAWAG